MEAEKTKTKTRGLTRTFLFIVYCIIDLISTPIQPSHCLLKPEPSCALLASAFVCQVLWRKSRLPTQKEDGQDEHSYLPWVDGRGV